MPGFGASMRWHGFREDLGSRMGTAEPEPKPEPDNELDTAPVGALITQSLINVAIAEERQFNREVMAAGSR